MDKMHKRYKRKHVLFVVENNQVPQDTRVWLEAKAIKEQGYNVSVICPNANKERVPYKTLDEIHIYQYPFFIEGSSIFSLLIEYLLSFFFISIYAFNIYRKEPFHIVHLANPPDFLILIFLFYKLLGIKIIFDHHDLSPELFLEKFKKKNVFYKALLFLEKFSYKFADVVIVTNNSFKEIGLKRNNVDVKKVHVVRSGPDISVVHPYRKNKNFRKGKKYIIGYVGKIDKQDGLSNLVTSVDYLVNQKKFDDFRVLIIGNGTELNNIKRMVSQKELDEYFIFYGPEYNKKRLFTLLSSVDICIDPQPTSDFQNRITSLKIMEYMALGKPIVQYRSIEGEYTAKNASFYVENNDPFAFGDAILMLLKDKRRRKEMGEYGIRRVRNLLQWEIQKKKLIRVYDEFFLGENIIKKKHK
ncbi:MAG: glycosyltransferase WbuB [Spirochaetes bacterium]|nr:MAG: glycosyltransferase WbuB [Spirochaetota bacterium]